MTVETPPSTDSRVPPFSLPLAPLAVLSSDREQDDNRGLACYLSEVSLYRSVRRPIWETPHPSLALDWEP
jgi:hypothetical protein